MIHTASDNSKTYHGPAIHDGSPTTDIIAALTAARTHSVPAVRDHLVKYLTGLLTSRTDIEHVTMADLETGDVVLTDVGAVVLTSERRTYPAQRAGDYVVRFESEMIDPDQFEHVAWIVRMNERDGVSRGHWGVQGTQWVTITRLARILP